MNSNEASRATTYWIAYIELRRCHMCVPTFFLPSFSGFYYNAGPSEQEGVEGAIAPPPLCFEWGFTRTYPGNQDVAVK